jgi:hypothetical protein
LERLRFEAISDLDQKNKLLEKLREDLEAVRDAK